MKNMPTLIQRKARKITRPKNSIGINSANKTEFLRLSAFVESRFDRKYLKDFVEAYKKNPESAKKLIKQWSEF